MSIIDRSTSVKEHGVWDSGRGRRIQESLGIDCCELEGMGSRCWLLMGMPIMPCKHKAS